MPAVRLASRCLCAPIALCIIGCVETVGVDVEIGEVQQPLMMGGSGVGDMREKGGKDFFDSANAAGATIGAIIVAPFILLALPFYYLCA